MTPEEFLAMQYERASRIGLYLEETGDDVYPFRVKRSDGTVVRENLRNALDVSEWLDVQDEEEASAREAWPESP